MPIDLTISQVLIVSDHSGPASVARSDGIVTELEDAAIELIRRFGDRPQGVRVPVAMFAAPLGGTSGRSRRVIAVVQFSEESDTVLVFHCLLLNQKLYEAIGDPFAIIDRFPPDWSLRGLLPLLQWPPVPPPARTVEQIATVLQNGDGPLLLGATQGLLDGTRVVLQRSAPDEAVLRSIWQLLPTRTRMELWPASFAFNPHFGFHISVMPNPLQPLPLGSIHEEQAKDYPQGSYELAVQIAAEHRNQNELDRLFSRRSSRDTLRLALWILGLAVLIAVIAKVIS
jgi:hypothetical protein